MAKKERMQDRIRSEEEEKKEKKDDAIQVKRVR